MKYYIIVDLEMCNVPYGSLNRKNIKDEIIQIGAVKMDENYEVVDGFDTYVKPEYGRVSRKITKLTGIRPCHVDSAILLKDAMDAFIKWLPEDYCMVSWSMSDRRQFENELYAKRINLGWLLEVYGSWRDCQKMFGDKQSTERQYRLQEALVASDIIAPGRQHDGLAAAYNTALLFKRLETEPDYKLNEYYLQAISTEKQPVMGYSLGDCLKGLCIDQISA